eukprot:scaffold5875_cov110-Skeletonema_marinoi.AAC.3
MVIRLFVAPSLLLEHRSAIVRCRRHGGNGWVTARDAGVSIDDDCLCGCGSVNIPPYLKMLSKCLVASTLFTLLQAQKETL